MINLISITILFSSICFSQNIYKDSREEKLFKFNFFTDHSLQDFSLSNNPTWSDFYLNFNANSLSNSDKVRFGISTKNYNYSLYTYQLVNFSKNIYSFLHARLVSNISEFENFNGLPKSVKRFGFESGEVIQSGLGYKNDWLMLQYGRGTQNWGAGDDIVLSISNSSPSFDHFILNLKKNNYSFRFIHGFLENIENHNRYITGKIVEYYNRNNFRFSLSEVIIYSGINRGFDLSYLNPVSSHLEIEFNENGNIPGSDLGNAIWTFSLDYQINKEFRLFLNLLIDELTIDQSERNRNKANGLASSFKIIFNPKRYESLYFSFSYVGVGTKTFRHRSGYGHGFNNFVYRNKPLGWKNGSDSQFFEFKINHKINSRVLNQISFSLLEIGEETITGEIYEPYQDYLVSSFPSGDIKRSFGCNISSDYFVRENLSYNLELDFYNINSNSETSIYFNIDYYFNEKS